MGCSRGRGVGVWPELNTAPLSCETSPNRDRTGFDHTQHEDFLTITT